MKKYVSYREIADILKKELHGKEGSAESYATLSEIKEKSVVFAKKFSEEIVALLNKEKRDFLAIVLPEYQGKIQCSYIISDHPRLDYIKIIERYFTDREDFLIHTNTVIEPGAVLGKNVNIGPNCYIGKQVAIGDNTYIYPNVVITGQTEIGCNCIIKSGAVIGQPGFGFEKNEQGIPIHFPHLGKIRIGDNVYIGANTAIDRATLGATIIGDHVKIDNLVHIAHNDIIEDNSFVIAGASLGGGVHVGKNCWIAPNACIKEQLQIGDNAVIGLGAVVIRNVQPQKIVIGNPAKELKK